MKVAHKRQEMPHIFEMRLRNDPFNRICKGEKAIEYRFHDEK